MRQKCLINWKSVRKAFLALDKNHDGLVNVDEFIDYFGNGNESQIKVLRKLF